MSFAFKVRYIYIYETSDLIVTTSSIIFSCADCMWKMNAIQCMRVLSFILAVVEAQRCEGWPVAFGQCANVVVMSKKIWKRLYLKLLLLYSNQRQGHLLTLKTRFVTLTKQRILKKFLTSFFQLRMNAYFPLEFISRFLSRTVLIEKIYKGLGFLADIKRGAFCDVMN